MITIKIKTETEVYVPDGPNCWESNRHSSLDCTHARYPDFNRMHCSLFGDIKLKLTAVRGVTTVEKCAECKKACGL